MIYIYPVGQLYCMVVICLDVCIIYFISCDCIMNSSLYYTIYLKNWWVRLLSNYNIKYICTIHTRSDTCLMSISRFYLRDKVTLLLLKLHFYGARCGRVVQGAGHKAKRVVLQCINGVSWNPVEGKKKFDSSNI
jgi:hypothetical protein